MIRTQTLIFAGTLFCGCIFGGGADPSLQDVGSSDAGSGADDLSIPDGDAGDPMSFAPLREEATNCSGQGTTPWGYLPLEGRAVDDWGLSGPVQLLRQQPDQAHLRALVAASTDGSLLKVYQGVVPLQTISEPAQQITPDPFGITESEIDVGEDLEIYQVLAFTENRPVAAERDYKVVSGLILTNRGIIECSLPAVTTTDMATVGEPVCATSDLQQLVADIGLPLVRHAAFMTGIRRDLNNRFEIIYGLTAGEGLNYTFEIVSAHQPPFGELQVTQYALPGDVAQTTEQSDDFGHRAHFTVPLDESGVGFPGALFLEKRPGGEVRPVVLDFVGGEYTRRGGTEGWELSDSAAGWRSQQFSFASMLDDDFERLVGYTALHEDRGLIFSRPDGFPNGNAHALWAFDESISSPTVTVLAATRPLGAVGGPGGAHVFSWDIAGDRLDTHRMTIPNSVEDFTVDGGGLAVFSPLAAIGGRASVGGESALWFLPMGDVAALNASLCP